MSSPDQFLYRDSAADGGDGIAGDGNGQPRPRLSLYFSLIEVLNRIEAAIYGDGEAVIGAGNCRSNRGQRRFADDGERLSFPVASDAGNDGNCSGIVNGDVPE